MRILKFSGCVFKNLIDIFFKNLVADFLRI